jgi:hypothetical protein
LASAEDQKNRFIIGRGEHGYDFNSDTVNPNEFDVDIYQLASLRDLQRGSLRVSLMSHERSILARCMEGRSRLNSDLRCWSRVTEAIMIALNLGGVSQDAKIIYEIIDRALCGAERRWNSDPLALPSAWSEGHQPADDAGYQAEQAAHDDQHQRFVVRDVMPDRPLNYILEEHAKE